MYFYAMQYIASQTLASVIEELRQQRQREKTETAAPLSQIADGLLSGTLAALPRSAGGPATEVYVPIPPIKPLGAWGRNQHPGRAFHRTVHQQRVLLSHGSTSWPAGAELLNMRINSVSSTVTSSRPTSCWMLAASSG